ncbi:ribonuclease M5 [Bacillus badius]|uniref:Ribonuclease M5 n=1 Tax=Bacillus badius TaxID=1455 RepID=A0ABR5APH5_BACBA|nr:ribonuclease M5 [Bacillus badius]KIL71992.1 Ribonuclease M5 [Bacillus badius]KIL75748.1 Ribonuclease M5 [Bacillus badius]KZO00951.1 ribonuclease M5 [Bacillus badius]KZR56715.1 ribonuclease M5 [Bacillus badius]MED0667652.1 ribonuclease M5 [Bacillus badius]
MKIKEIIVVEGKDDTTAIKRAVNADTIETNGSAVPAAVIESIKLAQETRGVIVFTDPDYPGERIRHIVAGHVPDCKHAFLPKHEAIEKRGRGVGVEHASAEAIRKALKDAQTVEKEAVEQISKEDLVDAGLIGGAQAKERRKRLGEKLRIGYTNGKQLYNRLLMFQITQEQFAQALKEVLQEERT